MQALCDEIAASGGSARAVRCDITDRDAIAALVAGVERDFGRLDILVQSAGVCFWGALEDMPAEKIEMMSRAGGGAIVTISSGAAVLGVNQFAVYAATKAAIQHFTRTLAPELRRSSIRVNSIGPGSVRTPMLGSPMTK